MLFIILFIFLQFSFCEQCPSSIYCICSSDLTIINCSNRQLTNELLLKLNTQLPKSTIVLNLSSNSLTSIKSLSNLNFLKVLDLSLNKIQYLPSNILLKYPQLISLNLQNNSLKILPKKLQNFSKLNINLLNNNIYCTNQSKWLKNIICQGKKKKIFLQIYPQKSQIAYENEQFILNCSSNLKHYWTLNKQFYPSKTIISSISYSTIIIDHLHINHSGIWTCHSLNINRSISLTVLKNLSNHFCQSIQMNTSKGYFYWPRTLINKKLEKKCPFGSAAWLKNSNEYARAFYTCSSKGQWIHFDVTQCAFQTNISRIFDYLSLNQTNLLLNLVKYLSNINKYYMKLDDIILLIDLIDEQQEKYQNQDNIMLIYHLTDFILQIKHNFKHLNKYRIATTRLRLIIERLLDFTNQTWLYIGKELTAMTIQSSPSSSKLYFIPNRSLLTIKCDIDKQHPKSQLATIQFLSYLNKTNHHSLFRIIFYRQSTLFTSNVTNHNNPVIYIRPVSINNFSTIKITFYNQINQRSIAIWHSNQTSWQIEPSICKINEQNINLVLTSCILFNNDSLSITYLNNINNNKKFIFGIKYSQLVIYISSIIASICLFISILYFICFHKTYQISRNFLHCLINYWFNLAILLPLFAFGIHFNQYMYLCQFISISLYFLCLTTILWLILLTYSIWKKLYIIPIDKDYHRKYSIMMINYDNKDLSKMELKSTSVIQFYFLGYGIAFIICGINVTLSNEQYITSKICFLNHFDSILILIIFMLIFVFLVLIVLFIANNLSNKSKNILSLKTNDISPILISSNENNKEILSNTNSHYSYSLNFNRQHDLINQLLSILFQLILLIFLFLSSLAIYLHPLHSFKIYFEHIIYSHLYGFFVLFLSFYILVFYVLLRYYFNRKNTNQLYIKSSLSTNSMTNKEYDIPSFIEQILASHSHCSSNIDIYENPQNTERIIINNKQHLTNISSSFDTFHHHKRQTNSLQNIPNDTLPFVLSNTNSQKNLNIHQSQTNSLSKQSLKKATNHAIQTENTQLHPSRIFPSQAIIRSLPIIRTSSQNTNKSLSNPTDMIQLNNHLQSSFSINKYNSTSIHLNKINHLIEQELSISKKSSDNRIQIVYIDEDDEHSLSLKSSICDSKLSTTTTSTKKDRSQTLSSSSDFSNDFHTNILHRNQIKLHESNV